MLNNIIFYIRKFLLFKQSHLVIVLKHFINYQLFYPYLLLKIDSFLIQYVLTPVSPPSNLPSPPHLQSLQNHSHSILLEVGAGF